MDKKKIESLPTIKNGKVASYKYIDAPNALQKANLLHPVGPVGQRLEPLMEMFRMDENALIYAEKFIKYYEGNFEIQMRH